MKFMDEGFKKGIIKVRRELALAVVVGTLEGGIIEREAGLEEELAEVLWKAITYQ
jgi:small ligand-binding sensory domain FIST